MKECIIILPNPIYMDAVFKFLGDDVYACGVETKFLDFEGLLSQSLMAFNLLFQATCAVPIPAAERH